MRSTVMRGGFVGAGTAFTTGRSTVSGRCATGATRAPGPMMPERMAPGTPSRSPPTTPHCMTCPAPAVSGGSTMIRATAGTLAGMMRAFGKARAAAARERGGTTFGPGGGGGGGAPGVTSVVTRNARPKVCGEISGASTAQPISTACPVNPMAVVQTLLLVGPQENVAVSNMVILLSLRLADTLLLWKGTLGSAPQRPVLGVVVIAFNLHPNRHRMPAKVPPCAVPAACPTGPARSSRGGSMGDRKSTRLNS